MKAFRFLAVGGLLVSGMVALAQNPLGYYKDALMFSQTSPVFGSTARIQAIGGAQTSLGGDISTVASNPAGLGFFNKSVVSFTPNMNFHNSTSNYMGEEFSSFRNNFNIGNIGVVLNSNKGNFTDEKFKAGSFAISYSRTNDFNNDFFYQRRNGASFIDIAIDDADITVPKDLPEYAYSAYQNYLIDPRYNETTEDLESYDSKVLGSPLQIENVRTSGSQGQLNFAWGGNYDDRVYFGVGFAFTSVKYHLDRKYREEAFLYEDTEGNPQIDNLISYTEIEDDLNVSGGGVTANLGLIVRPVNFVTVGVSYNTPTYYSLEDESGFVQRTYWNGLELSDGEIIDYAEHESTIYINKYNLRTPGKVSVGTTFFLGKVGFITGDVQFVDYTGSQLRSSDFNEVDDNSEIESRYRNTINYNVGGEFRLDKFRFRGGYAHFGDPFDDGDSYDEGRRNITFGVGYRNKDYFIDLAVINSRYDHLFESYFPAIQGGYVDIENETTTIAATVGFNF